MNKVNDIKQIESICSSLLNGFINWIKIKEKEEIAAILDSAYEFKLSIINKNHLSLQGKYFTNPQHLTSEEYLILVNQWRVTFIKIVNSKLDRISKDSFKLWFLSLATLQNTNLKQEASLLWTELFKGIDYCKKFSIKDIPYPYNTIANN